MASLHQERPMKVENHKLVDVPGPLNLEVDLTQKWAPNRKWPLTPKGIMIHYDVCQTLDSQTNVLFASGLYYHVGLDGRDNDGEPPQVRQYVPFNRRAIHAKGYNDTYIGICIVNPGPVFERPDGSFVDVHKKPWPSDQVAEGIHPRGPKNWTHWATYSYEERDTVLEICRALLDEYPSINTICGHDWVSPGRKFDPGPLGEAVIMRYIRGEFPHINVPELPGYAE
jgi:N-acetylmuramoyl-L-alanine amidase